jgi:signal transduction histidine kinase
VLGVRDVEFAAPLLFLAIALTAYVVLDGEHGRARELVKQGLVFAAITAALSTIGLSIFFRLLPDMTPGGGRSIAWVAFVIFFAALPLDAVRVLVVEAAGRALFRRPIGVRDLAEQVEQTEVRADHAERLAEIGTMASAVAHEIRNPLGVIAAQAKLLERAGASEKSVRALRHEVGRAKKFLDDLLRYSKPRPLDIQEIDAAAALELAAENVRQLLGEGAPRIEVLAETGSELGLEVDRAAYNDVAVALLHNAAVAACGKTDGAAGRVMASVKRGAAGVVVEVEDDGPGVPPAIEDSLFRPFVTGRGRDATHPGTGLGLAIAARWVERHGGTLRHERPAAGGARFVVSWPRRPGPA